jgi:hypothetical protein
VELVVRGSWSLEETRDSIEILVHRVQMLLCHFKVGHELFRSGVGKRVEIVVARVHCAIIVSPELASQAVLADIAFLRRTEGFRASRAYERSCGRSSCINGAS